MLLSSASSKTAFGTAFCLSLRRGQPGAPRIVGLTSAGNLEFCRSLGCYDELRTYDTVGTMDRSVPSVYVDFAGNVALRRPVHEHFGDTLRYSCSVGGTHWDELGRRTRPARPAADAVLRAGADRQTQRARRPRAGARPNCSGAWGRPGHSSSAR